MCNLYRGPSIDASYQVSVHLAKRFQRRRLKCEKLTDDGCKNEIGAAKEYCLNIVSRRKGGIMLFSDQLLRRDF
jgi:hypothetical protein